MAAWLLAADAIDTGLRWVLGVGLPLLDPIGRVAFVEAYEGYTRVAIRSDLVRGPVGVAIDLRTVHFTIVLYVTLVLLSTTRGRSKRTAVHTVSGIGLLVTFYAASVWVLAVYALTIAEPHVLGLPTWWYRGIPIAAEAAVDTGVQIVVALLAWAVPYGIARSAMP